MRRQPYSLTKADGDVMAKITHEYLMQNFELLRTDPQNTLALRRSSFAQIPTVQMAISAGITLGAGWDARTWLWQN
jgi:hypothetical protein